MSQIRSFRGVVGGQNVPSRGKLRCPTFQSIIIYPISWNFFDERSQPKCGSNSKMSSISPLNREPSVLKMREIDLHKKFHLANCKTYQTYQQLIRFFTFLGSWRSLKFDQWNIQYGWRCAVNMFPSNILVMQCPNVHSLSVKLILGREVQLLCKKLVILFSIYQMHCFYVYRKHWLRYTDRIVV